MREYRTEQCAVIPLYRLSICSSFSDLGGNAKGNGATASVMTFANLCRTPPGLGASSKGKAGALIQRFPAAPQELCQGRAECSTSAHRTPISAQKYISLERRSQSRLCGNFQFTLLANTDELSITDEPYDKLPESQLKSTIARGW